MSDKHKQLELINGEISYMYKNPVGFAYNRGGLERARIYFQKLQSKRKELMTELIFR